MNHRDDLEKGFTLVELLIVVAIIGMLLAVAIPVFTSQLERSRETTDLANVRTAYGAIMVDGAIGDKSSAYYQSDGTYWATVQLKQGQDGWATSTDKLIVAGVRSGDTNWVGVPRAHGTCTVQYIPATGVTTIYWGRPGNPAYVASAMPFEKKGLMELKQKNNADRVEADRSTLKALGTAILNEGWTIADLKRNLGILATGNAVRIADFYQDKTGSYEAGGTYASDGFRIAGTDKLHTILKEMGYDGGASTSTDQDGKTVTTYEHSLFYSDELATNKFKNYAIDQTKRSIIIDNIETDSSGTIVSMHIYAKAMDGQANLNAQEKAQFNITVKK